MIYICILKNLRFIIIKGRDLHGRITVASHFVPLPFRIIAYLYPILQFRTMNLPICTKTEKISYHKNNLKWNETNDPPICTIWKLNFTISYLVHDRYIRNYIGILVFSSLKTVTHQWRSIQKGYKGQVRSWRA